jgi:hypothetical protein
MKYIQLIASSWGVLIYILVATLSLIFRYYLPLRYKKSSKSIDIWFQASSLEGAGKFYVKHIMYGTVAVVRYRNVFYGYVATRI